MPDEPNNIVTDASTLAVGGVLCVSRATAGARTGACVVLVGPAAGWMSPVGIAAWERELSFIARADMTPELAKALHATLPHEQIARARFPLTFRAAQASPLLGLAGNLVEDARARGVRVHTVGVDRVSGDFFYFAGGGAGEPVNAQGNLVDMLTPSLTESTTNAEIEALLAGLIDRLLAVLSGGVVSELEVELADALPRLSRDGTGLVGTDLDAFEARARLLADRASGTVGDVTLAAARVAEAITAAGAAGQSSARVALFGDARRELIAPLQVRIGGKAVLLPARSRWVVTGAISDVGDAVETRETVDIPRALERRAPSENGEPPRAPVQSRPLGKADEPARAEKAAAPARAEKAAAPARAEKAPGPARAEKAAAPARAEKAAAPARAEKAPEPTPIPEPARAEPVLEPSPLEKPAALESPSVAADIAPLPRRARRPAGPTKSSPVVMVFLLLAFAATLYLSLHTAFSPR
jgi:hypothetical protein